MNALESVLILVERCGFAVIPIHTIDPDTGACTCGQQCSSPGKHPLSSLVPHGVHDATQDTATVKQWAALWPDCNWAVATGAISGVTVWDVDADKGGIISWNNLQRRHSDVTDVWISKTGSEGYHYWFRYVEGLKNRVGIIPGCDLRNDNGYVLVPPSLHVSGRTYQWLEHFRPSASFQQTGEMPDWLVTLAGGSNQKERAAALPEVISEGGRNQWLASIAGTMRARNMSLEAVEAALMVENQKRCSPPLDEREVERIARSIDRYPAVMAGRMTFGGVRQ